MRDFYFAFLLRCVGYELHLQPEGRRPAFVFRDTDARRSDAMAFYGNDASVRPLALSATIMDMKALLRNA